MIIAARYSFNGGEEAVSNKYSSLLEEIELVIATVTAQPSKVKVSKEKTMPGQVLYSPIELNKVFTAAFNDLGWKKQRVVCDYPTGYYDERYQGQRTVRGGFREMDFVKNGLGIEVQFGKYSFMVYNVAAKMTIFRNLGYIDTGVEIVPVKRFAEEMSSGVSYFEQFVWDLEQRGIADIDVPVLILGIDDEW
ncbi:MAG: restriction endonuclease [Chloroflexi bacterium]|nr:restriction endonuclease [Chloroflexota bacterium]